ncbi:peptidase inhibitor family I36 protein [Streptomyces sp. NPDC051561]|uniref:peptidase inhibitor family I36 protein n=1 Tax=Streptomyces sp. NPDC051561 TaxID=3365658 RepID=UPI0037A0E04C
MRRPPCRDRIRSWHTRARTGVEDNEEEHCVQAGTEAPRRAEGQQGQKHPEGQKANLRRVGSALALAVSTTALVLPTAAPAVAASAGDCSSVRTVCLFAETGFTGERLTVSSSAAGGTCVNLDSSGWAGPARSVVNTHSRSGRPPPVSSVPLSGCEGSGRARRRPPPGIPGVARRPYLQRRTGHPQPRTSARFRPPGS